MHAPHLLSSKVHTWKEMKAQLLKMRKQFDLVWVQVEDHSGKEEESGKGQRGKERDRSRWRKVKYSRFIFWGALLPAGPRFLTCWLEDRGKKKSGKRVKRLKLCVRLQGERWKS